MKCCTHQSTGNTAGNEKKNAQRFVYANGRKFTKQKQRNRTRIPPTSMQTRTAGHETEVRGTRNESSRVRRTSIHYSCKMFLSVRFTYISMLVRLSWFPPPAPAGTGTKKKMRSVPFLQMNGNLAKRSNERAERRRTQTTLPFFCPPTLPTFFSGVHF